MTFQFGFKQKSGRYIIELDHISKAYGDLQILKNTSATIERGDKIAMIGANGKGKSTMLRIIAGSEPIEGERKEGYNVNTAFYAQHQLEALSVENEILDELKQAGSLKTESELRGILGCFLFQGDEVFKKIKVLSGGEKSRVALAKTLLSEANFLMMDEPTNHLDFLSVNILVQALQQYEGTFVIVSHDRDFISQIANKIWYIEDHELKEYPGTYAEYEYWRKQNDKPEKEVIEDKPKKEKKEKPRLNNDAEKELKKLQKELNSIENEIEKLEKRKSELETQLAEPDIFKDHGKLAEVSTKHQKTVKGLEEKNTEWENVAEKIEEIEG